MKRTLFPLFLMLIILSCLLTSCGMPTLKRSGFSPTEGGAESPYVCIEVKDYGVIIVELYPTVAPKTVENFKSLVGRGFYDGSTFHRIIEGFMIQGGTSATGEYAAPIEGEFYQNNGFSNPLKHERGVISMARTDYFNSATSQFFIVHETSPHLDGLYAAFGRVVYGMETVDAIAKTQTNLYDAPLTDVVITRAFFVEK